MQSSRLFTVIAIPVLAAFYFAASKLGFTMAFEAEQVTIVWPPTGMALTALLLFGYRMWPGVMLGAFLANVTTHEPVATAFCIAIGNTLEAVSGAWMLRRFVGFNNSLARVKDVLGLVICSAGLSTLISATIGVASLCMGGVQPWTAYRSLWAVWWLGDATGALIFAPILLVWGSPPFCAWRPKSVVEALAAILGVAIICVAIFTKISTAGVLGDTFLYLVFPFIIWASLRFGQHGTTFITLVASIIAIWGTVHGLGPFAVIVTDRSLALLQIFMAVTAVTGLLLSAAISERRHAEKALKEADRRKNEFLATLAHELRNPLAPLSNALHILQSPATNEAQQREARGIMAHQMQQMVRLVDDLLDVSRISHGKIELHKKHITLAEIIKNATETATPLIEENRHDISIRLPEETLWLDADPTRLSQLFANLLNNAAKYTPPGGQLWLEAVVEENNVVVRVRDTGIGIPASLLPHVFDMFTQADTSIERAHGGLGIGLTLVKTLAEMHGGSVEVHSQEKNQGSEFTVRLPLAHPPQTAEHSLPVENPQMNGEPRHFRILVTDDSAMSAKTLGYMLEILGHEIRLAYDGASAVEIAKSFVPDIIFLDIGLPGMSGYEVCRKLRTEPALAHCIIIAQTGWGQEEHRQRSKEAGFDHHLVKPVDLSVLEELLLSL